MKTTKKLVLFTVLQALFCCVAPLAFIFAEYGYSSEGLKYKLPLGALLVALIVIAIAKNTFLKPRIMRLSAAIAQHDADLKVESDTARAANIEIELKRERTAETLLTAVTPVLVLAALLIACKAMENAILQMSGAIGFSLASYVIGTAFGVAAAREVHGKHGGAK